MSRNPRLAAAKRQRNRKREKGARKRSRQNRPTKTERRATAAAEAEERKKKAGRPFDPQAGWEWAKHRMRLSSGRLASIVGDPWETPEDKEAKARRERIGARAAGR